MTGIKKLCYELYKIDWKHSHGITAEIESDSIKDYYEGLVDPEHIYTYEDYLLEFGYNGEMYSCPSEFLDCEYQEEAYMCSLLDNDKLIKLYQEDIKEE